MNNDAFSILFGGLPQETEVSIEKTQEATPKVSTPVIPEQVAETQKTEVQTTLEEKVDSPRVFVAPSKQKAEKKKKNKSDFLPLWLLREKLKNFFKETKAMIIIFLSILCVFYFFTNAQLVFYTFKDAFTSVNAAELHQISETLMHNAADNTQEDNIKQIEKRFAEIQNEHTTGNILSLGMDELVQGKSQDLNYNILPPTNRLIIPDLNINVPLIDTESNGRVDFSQENFDDELTKGVVKYPTTPTPGSKGNTLIFGHTSTEWWKKNEYGVVFRNIPKLKVGQRFQVVRNGQLTTYEMVERKVVLPKNVEDYYHQFSEQNESYLTLMGCYPIGTADKRMMIVAKKIPNP